MKLLHVKEVDKKLQTKFFLTATWSPVLWNVAESSYMLKKLARWNKIVYCVFDWDGEMHWNLAGESSAPARLACSPAADGVEALFPAQKSDSEIRAGN